MKVLLAILFCACLFLSCKLAENVAWQITQGATPTAASPMLGSANVVPFPVPQPPVRELDWIGLIGIVAVQLLTWWLGRRDRRVYHGGHKQVELKQYHPGGG